MVQKKELTWLLIITIICISVLLGSCKKEAAPAQQIEPETEYPQVASELPPTQDTTASVAPKQSTSYPYTWTDAEDIPPIVIIIDDFGYSGGKLLEDFAALPSEIVFAILPDLVHTKTAAELAKKTGHEVIIHIPMEARGSKITPGEKHLIPGMSAEKVADMLDNFIEQMPMAIAGNNHMGSSATEDLDLMKNTISHLDSKGLFFIDSVTTNKSKAVPAAEDLGVFITRRDIFLDVPDNTNATIAQKIQSLAKYKGRKEPIVIITHCHNRDKLVALDQFITQVTALGVKIISLRQAFGKLTS